MLINRLLIGVACLTWTASAAAVASAELYTSKAYGFGRFSARMQFAPGNGVVSSFFLWKDGSEQAGTFWNELDIEKLEDVCRVETNAIYGNPQDTAEKEEAWPSDLCTAFHTYAYEWTPDYIAWSLDGKETRRETAAVAQAFKEHAIGMQLRFNVWPGDETFGGPFNSASLPVYQYIDWVEYASYVNGTFEVQWREEFAGSGLPSGWATGSWESPKGLSTHSSTNIGFVNGYAVLALTPDDAKGVNAAAVPSAAPVPAASASASSSAPIPVASTPTVSPNIATQSGCACRTLASSSASAQWATFVPFLVGGLLFTRRRTHRHTRLVALRRPT